jgi:hypothetical protein
MCSINIDKEMKESYVAFIDVLGFKKMVFADKTEKLQSFFDIAIEELRSNNDGDNQIDSTIISDSIVLFSPFTTVGFTNLIKAIQNIQVRFIMEDIWMRGAVSYGDICFFKEKNIVLGKGLINAYLLEQQAKYPRVIIDSKIINTIGTDSANFLEIVNGSYLDIQNSIRLIHPIGSDIENDSYYVDYAEKLIYDSMVKDEFEILYNIIKENMYKEHAYFAKYHWVQRYLSKTMHNYGFAIRHVKNLSTEKRHDFFTWRKKFGNI